MWKLFIKLVNYIAIIIELKHYLMNKKKISQIVDFEEITVKELLYPENLISLEAQRELYPKEINALRNNKPLLKTSNLLSSRPFLSDNLLQIGSGRLRQSFLSFYL